MGGAIDRVVVHSNVDFNAEVGKTFSYGATQITESGVWVAEVPELPGCACHAETEEKALCQIKSLIPEWIATARESGRPVPEARGRHAFA